MNKQAELNQILARLDVAAEDRAALSRDIAALYDRTNDLDATDATLAGDLSEVTARVEALESAAAPKAPAREPIEQPDPCGILRDARGVVVSTTTDSYADRMAALRDRMDTEDDAFWERATAGLPLGQWRDPTGLIRNERGERVKLATEAAT